MCLVSRAWGSKVPQNILQMATDIESSFMIMHVAGSEGARATGGALSGKSRPPVARPRVCVMPAASEPRATAQKQELQHRKDLLDLHRPELHYFT